MANWNKGKRASSEGGVPQSNAAQDAAPAHFKLVYESRDKRYCLFEDRDGHLTSVRTSRLA